MAAEQAEDVNEQDLGGIDYCDVTRKHFFKLKAFRIAWFTIAKRKVIAQIPGPLTKATIARHTSSSRAKENALTGSVQIPPKPVGLMELLI